MIDLALFAVGTLLGIAAAVICIRIFEHLNC